MDYSGRGFFYDCYRFLKIFLCVWVIPYYIAPTMEKSLTFFMDIHGIVIVSVVFKYAKSLLVQIENDFSFNFFHNFLFNRLIV